MLATGNYRTVSVNLGSYANERTYEIFNGATEIVTVEFASWAPGTIQSTFTL